MKKYFLQLIGLPLILILYGCDFQSETVVYTPPEFQQISLLGKEIQRDPYSYELEPESIEPMIPGLPRQNIIFIENHNLDFDDAEEQIIVHRIASETETMLRLLVLDYNPVRNEYLISFEKDLMITDYNSFNLLLLDVIGDYVQEIVITGLNADNEQVIYIFRSNQDPMRLGYDLIFHKAVEGEIEIRQTERGSDYIAMRQHGESFPIVTTQNNPDDNYSKIETIFYWRFQTKQYEQLTQRIIPQQDTQTQRMQQILNYSVDDMLEIFTGLWSLNSGRVILSLDEKSRLVSIYESDIQQIFSITQMYKFRSRLQLETRNILLPNIISGRIRIDYIDEDTIYVNFEDTTTTSLRLRESWSGRYTKYQPQAISHISPLPQHINLDGYFLSDAGSRLYFKDNTFTFFSSDRTEQGGYAYYGNDEKVLKLRYISAAGIQSRTETYLFSYSEEKSSERIIRTIILTPAKITVHGIETTSSDVQRFEQFESLVDN